MSKSETFSVSSTLIICKEISKARDFSHLSALSGERGTFWRQNLKRSARNELLMVTSVFWGQLVTRNYCFSGAKRIQVEQAENATLFKSFGLQFCAFNCYWMTALPRGQFCAASDVQILRTDSEWPLMIKVLTATSRQDNGLIILDPSGISDCIGFLSFVSSSFRSFIPLGSDVFTLATGQRAPHSK